VGILLIDLEEMIQELARIDGDAAQLMRIPKHEAETQSTLVGRGFCSVDDGRLLRMNVVVGRSRCRGRGAAGDLTRVCREGHSPSSEGLPSELTQPRARNG